MLKFVSAASKSGSACYDYAVIRFMVYLIVFLCFAIIFRPYPTATPNLHLLPIYSVSAQLHFRIWPPVTQLSAFRAHLKYLRSPPSSPQSAFPLSLWSYTCPTSHKLPTTLRISTALLVDEWVIYQ